MSPTWNTSEVGARTIALTMMAPPSPSASCSSTYTAMPLTCSTLQGAGDVEECAGGRGHLHAV